MKKLLVLIAYGYAVSMHAMEVNERLTIAKNSAAYKGIKQLIMNPPIIRCLGTLDVEFLTAEQRSELAQLTHKEWQNRFGRLWKTTAGGKIDISSLEVVHQVDNLDLIAKMLEIPTNPTNN